MGIKIKTSELCLGVLCLRLLWDICTNFAVLTDAVNCTEDISTVSTESGLSVSPDIEGSAVPRCYGGFSNQQCNCK